MILSEKSVRRLGIFFFYDKDGAADEYVRVLLDGIRPCLAELLVVCNGELDDGSRAVLEKIADHVLVRENRGFDVWAYKEGIEYYGWEQLGTFDETVLFNFTIYGPIYPFSETFEKMNAKDLDFWGLTVHNGAPFDPWGKMKMGYLPLHLQSHFIAVRRPMLLSAAFQKYWDEMRKVNSYEEAVSFHEAIFTKHFSDRGFKWESSVDTEDIDQEYTFYPLMMMPVELVRDRRCPIVKRKSFFLEIEDYLSTNMGEAAYELFNFLKNKTGYDTDLILSNLLRTGNQWDIKNCLQLNYILPHGTRFRPIPENPPKVALLMHIYFEDLIEYCAGYARSMPEYADIYVTTDTEEKKLEIEKIFGEIKCGELDVRVTENRGRDVSALLVAGADFLRDYDYVCFAHDKKGTNISPKAAGESFSYLCFESILKSREYVDNVISTFEENPLLGLLTPPPPIHSNYFAVCGYEWSTVFDGCEKLAAKLGLKADMDRLKAPVAPLGTEFWFRPKALGALFDYGFTYDDFPAESSYRNPRFRKRENLLHQIERLYAVAVQSEGYYPAWVMPDTVASMEITMLYAHLSRLNQTIPNDGRPLAASFMERLNRVAYFDKTLNEYKSATNWYQKHLRGMVKNAKWHAAHLSAARRDIRWQNEQIDMRNREIAELLSICKSRKKDIRKFLINSDVRTRLINGFPLSNGSGLMAECEALRRQISEMERSTSWRVTGWIRKIGDFLQKRKARREG